MSEADFEEGDLILYRTANGTSKISVLYQGETFWLNPQLSGKSGEFKMRETARFQGK